MSVEVYNETSASIDEGAFIELSMFAFESLHVHPETELSIIFVDTDGISKLNSEWMGSDGPTDVLSFPMDELRPGRHDSLSSPGLLGDLVICPEIAMIQAENAGHSLQHEMNTLLVHGILHLLGFDHATPLEEAEMFGLQDGILDKFASESRGK